MDIQTLDALDQKIARLLSKLTELQEENHKMSGELNTLRQQQAQATNQFLGLAAFGTLLYAMSNKK